MVKMLVAKLKLESPAPLFWSAVHFLSHVKPVFAFLSSIIMESLKGDEQECEKATFEKEKQFLSYVKVLRNFNWNPVWKILHHVSAVE